MPKKRPGDWGLPGSGLRAKQTPRGGAPDAGRWQLIGHEVDGIARRILHAGDHGAGFAEVEPKPEAVIAAEARFYRERNANVHRGMHALAAEATDVYEDCRKRTARFLGLNRPEQVVVQRGTTSWQRLKEILATEPSIAAGPVGISSTRRLRARLSAVLLGTSGTLDP